MSPIRLWALAFLTLILAGPAAAAIPPVTPAVEGHVKAYVAAVNAEGEAAADAFRDAHTAKGLAESVPRGAFAILGNQDWAAPGLGDAIRGLIAEVR